MTAQPWPVADASVLAPVSEHEELRTVLRDLLETHAPHDEVRRAAELPEGWSPKLWSLLNEEMDVGSLAVPEERGGQGFGVAVVAVVLEEAGRALLPEPLLLSSVLGVRAVLAAPAGSVPDDVVSGVVDGRLVATLAFEHDADTDLTLSDDAGTATVSGRVGRVLLGGAADLLVVGIGPRGRESIHLVDLRATRRGHAHRARGPRPHPPPGPTRAGRRPGTPDRRPGRGGRARHRAGHPAAGRAGRRARRNDRGDARPDPHPPRAAPPVRPPAGVVPGDQAPARRRARRPGAGPVGGSLRGGGLRPGPVLGRAGLGRRGSRVHRRGHPGGSRDRPAARRHRLHLGAPGPLLPPPGPG